MFIRPQLSGTVERSGLWSLAQGGLVCLEPAASGRAVVLVPSEHVLILTADLPLATSRARLAALPFALEDRVAEPLDEVHIALGSETSPKRYLAAVVRHVLMADWVARLAAEGLGRAALVPDAFALPVPEETSWSVGLHDGRALVRTPEGTGFAIPLSLLPAAWAAAGRPFLVSYGQPLPPELPSTNALSAPGSLLALLAPPPLDLRQGPYSARDLPAAAMVRRLAMVLGAGVVAHAAIAGADTLALQGIARDRHEQALALMRQVAPNTPPEADLVAEFDRLYPTVGGGRSGLLPLMSRTFAALQPLSSEIAVQTMGYVAADNALRLKVEASNMAGLQRIDSTLAAAGLATASGASTSEQGAATGEIVVRAAR
jgi:general secretion pathway protein L